MNESPGTSHDSFFIYVSYLCRFCNSYLKNPELLASEYLLAARSALRALSFVAHHIVHSAALLAECLTRNRYYIELSPFKYRLVLCCSLFSQIADPEVIYYSYLINAITYIIVGTTEKWVKRGCVDPPEDIIRLTYDVGVGVQHTLTRIRSSKD